jgi:hypothetical protein
MMRTSLNVPARYFTRVIVRPWAPSRILNNRPLLIRILPIVYTALLYSRLLLERMADRRMLLLLLLSASSLVRSFVFAVIRISRSLILPRRLLP